MTYQVNIEIKKSDDSFFAIDEVDLCLNMDKHWTWLGELPVTADRALTKTDNALTIHYTFDTEQDFLDWKNCADSCWDENATALTSAGFTHKVTAVV